jgi:hypothetical protein
MHKLWQVEQCELKNFKTFQNPCKQIVVDRRGALRSLKTQNPKILMHKVWQIEPFDLWWP